MVKLGDLTEGAHIERELMLIKVRATGAAARRDQALHGYFPRPDRRRRAATLYTIQLTGTSEKLDAFVQAVADAEILEVVRCGVAGIARGERVLSL